MIAQKLNSIFTNIEFLPQIGPIPALSITSPNKGEGKTFFLNNYAHQLVKNQKKVLLIDTDFYNPELSRLYKLRHYQGLTDYIIKGLPIDEVINPLIHDRLDMIPAGTNAPSHLEILKSSSFSELIQGIKKAYDYILVDCPPLKLFPDAKITSQSTDGTIIVVNPTKTTISDVQYCKKELDTNNKVAGVIINQKKYNRKELKYYRKY
jgi:capsular exopolysaccharide synthesis family protein